MPETEHLTTESRAIEARVLEDIQGAIIEEKLMV